MAVKTESISRGTIAANLTTPLKTHDRQLRPPLDKLTEGDVVVELGKGQKYASWRADGRRQVTDSVPVHWLALMPRRGELVKVEFGIGKAALGLPYNEERERQAVREDILAYEPNLKRDVVDFYRGIRPTVMGRVADDRLFAPRHVIFAAAERRYPVEAVGDPDLGWTQIIASSRLTQTPDIIDSHTGVNPPAWMREAAWNDSPKVVADVMKIVAMNALADVVRDRPA